MSRNTILGKLVPDRGLRMRFPWKRLEQEYPEISAAIEGWVRAGVGAGAISRKLQQRPDWLDTADEERRHKIEDAIYRRYFARGP